MLLLSRQGQKERRPQITYQLDLCARGLQREDIILVKNRHGLQRVVIPRIIAGIFIRHNIQQNFYHALLPRQLLRLCRNTVELITQGNRPRQILKRLFRLPLKVEMIRHGSVKAERRFFSSDRWRSTVGEIHNLIIGAVIRQAVFTVKGITFHHASLQQIAIVIQCCVICLIISRNNTITNRFRCCRHNTGYRQRCRQQQSRYAVLQSSPCHNDSSI